MNLGPVVNSIVRFDNIHPMDSDFIKRIASSILGIIAVCGWRGYDYIALSNKNVNGTVRNQSSSLQAGAKQPSQFAALLHPFVLGIKPFMSDLTRATRKASDTVEHQPTVWPLPYACSQPNHQDSGSHGQLFQPS